MVFDFSVALTWILFLALFPISFFWLRRAWRIFFKRDFSEVALKGGESPPHPEEFATYAGVFNLVAGAIAVGTILLVVILGVPYSTWSAVAGSTIFCKLFADFGLSRHAHAKWGKPKGSKASGKTPKTD